MKKQKKSYLFTTGIATAVVASSVIPAASVAANDFFTDVNENSALYKEILDLYNQGKIDGFKDGTFRPYEAVTRGQAAKIIAAILELDTNHVEDPGLTDITKDKWYYGSVAALVKADVVDGFKDSTFRPNQVLTRAEASRIINKAFKLKFNEKTNVPFNDVKNDIWYYKDVQALLENGVTKGKTKDQFAPNDQVTRSELVAFASRAKQAVEKSQTIESIQDGSVTIEGITYKVDNSLSGLLNTKNAAALKNAQISFDSKDGVIVKIKSLTLTNGGTSGANTVLDAGGAVIDGAVIVEGDYYELKNLVINGDLTVTEHVKNSFITEKLTVKGHTRVAEQTTAAASAFRIAAENPKTKITIIFKDSTMATIEIAQDDVYFSATGTTKVTSISLHANANITADPDVIIPKVDIKKGVTLVELNVTIKEVIIESNDDIKVTGKGNVENVVINTDKNVTLDTKGTIKNLESKNDKSQVTVGDQAKITNIKVPEGKEAGDVIENFNDVKGQIEKVGGTANPDYTPSTPSTGGGSSSGGTSNSGGGSGDTSNPGDYFDAGILEVENRFGYVQLNVFNQGAYKVKYVIVDRDDLHEFSSSKVGETVPANAIEYHEGDEFILWNSSEIFIYQVDDEDKIVDIVDTNETWHTFPVHYEIDKEKGKLKIQTIVNPSGKTQAELLENVYLFGSNKAYKLDLSKGNWTETDGIPTIELNPENDMNLDAYYRLYIEGYNFSALTSLNYSQQIAEEEQEKADVIMIKYAAQEMQDDHTLGWFLDYAAYETKTDENGHTTRDSIVEKDSVSANKYRMKIKEQQESLVSHEAIKTLVEAVNAELKAKVDVLKIAQEAVSNLYREDRYDYEYNDRLKPGLTQNEIDTAIQAVENVSSEFKEKEQLLFEAMEAQFQLTAGSGAKKEITLQDLSIGTPISNLLYNSEKFNSIKVRINSIGNEFIEDTEHPYVSGKGQYLGVDESGNLVLNRKNTSGNNQTEYVSVDFSIGNRHLGNNIIAITIPSTSEADEKSSDTGIIKKTEVPFINQIRNNAASPMIYINDANIKVNDLLSSIQSEDGTTQAYQVKSSNGTVKTEEEQLVHGDILAVTAENGVSKKFYKVNIPLIITEKTVGTLGQFTIKVENTSAEELQSELRIYRQEVNGTRSWETKFTLQQAKNEDGSLKENYYDIVIPSAVNDMIYNIHGQNKTVWDYSQNNSYSVFWPSILVTDANASPDNQAFISVPAGLSITADSIDVKLAMDGSNDWKDSIEWNGVTIASDIQPDENGKYIITFTSQGEIDSQVETSLDLDVIVTVGSTEDKDSIHLNLSPTTGVTVN